MDSSVAGLIGVLLGAAISAGVPVIRDWIGWKREDEQTEFEQTYDSASALLKVLAVMGHWTDTSIKNAAGARELEEVYSDLRAKHLVWRMCVWQRLDTDRQQSVLKIGERLAGVHTANDLSRGPGNSDVPGLVDVVIEITHWALKRS